MYHGWSLEKTTGYIYSLVKEVLPDILNISGQDEAKYTTGYSKALERQVSGTESKVIEYSPLVFEHSENFLKARGYVRDEMAKIIDEEPEDQIFKGTGIREKDIYRLDILMESAVEKTFFGPTALTQPYTEEYINRATEYFSLMNKVGFKPFVYIRKRSTSSNGSLSRTPDMTVYQSTMDRFKDLLLNNKSLLYKYHLPTLLLSRIMAKNAIKPRMVEDQNGKTITHDRTIKGEILSEVAHLVEKYNLSSGQHRSVCNVSDLERATQMLTQQSIEAMKYSFFTMMRYKPGIMEHYYNCGYKYVVCTDATKFDQSISEVLMRALYKVYSEAIQLMDLEKFRDNKHITWYNTEKDQVVSLNHMVKNRIHDTKLEFEEKCKQGLVSEKDLKQAYTYLDKLDQLNFIGGVDSGNPHVSHDGKMNMVGSIYVMFKDYFGMTADAMEFSRNFFELEYTQYVRTMKEKKLDKYIVEKTETGKGRVAICNSSDDNFLATSEKWIADAYKQLIQYCIDSPVRPFLLAEADAEFLSEILIEEDGVVKQIGNPARKMQSRLVGEYSGRKEDGSFKDMVGATEDRDKALRLSKTGTRLLEILDEAWEKYFGMPHAAYIKKHMSGVKVNEEVLDHLKAVRITPNEADRELASNPDKAYYREDIVDRAHQETLDILFTNISPVQTYEIYEKAGQLDYVCEQIGTFGKVLRDTITHTETAIDKGYCPSIFTELYDIAGLKLLADKADKYSNAEELKKEILRLAEVDRITKDSGFELREEDVI